MEVLTAAVLPYGYIIDLGTGDVTMDGTISGPYCEHLD